MLSCHLQAISLFWIIAAYSAERVEAAFDYLAGYLACRLVEGQVGSRTAAGRRDRPLL
jgi:hypothetical protein